MHIFVYDSLCVDKTRLNSTIRRQEAAKADEGLFSVTQTINLYAMEGHYNTGLSTIYYKYKFLDNKYAGEEKHRKVNNFRK